MSNKIDKIVQVVWLPHISFFVFYLLQLISKQIIIWFVFETVTEHLFLKSEQIMTISNAKIRRLLILPCFQ